MKNKIDIGLTHFHSFRHIEFTMGVVSRLKKLGLSVVVVTNKPKIRDFFKTHGVTSESFDVTRSSVYSDHECDSLFKVICDKYNISDNFTKFIEVDYLQSEGMYSNRLELKNKVISSFSSIEKSLVKYEISVFVQMLASEVERRVFYYYGNLNGNAFYYHNSLLPIKPFVFIKNEMQEVLNVKRTNSVTRDVAFFQNALTQARSSGTYLRKVENKRINFIQKHTNILDDYKHYRSKKETALKILKFRTQLQKKIIYKFKSMIYSYKKPLRVYPEGKYVFFPLHQPNEAQTLVRGGHFHDELFLLDYISKEIPSGCRLICKMHPRVEFQYDKSWLKRLNKLESVEVIDSGLDSVEIMRNAVVTVTINSSVWMESMILNLPCLTFGRGYFSWNTDYPYQVDLDNFLTKYKLAESKNLVNQEFNKVFLNSHYAQAFLMKRIKGSTLTPKWLGNAIFYLNSSVGRQKK